MGDQILTDGTRTRLAKAALSVVMTLLFLVVTELGFRAARYIVKGPDIELSETVDDPELGWRLNTQRDGLTKTNMCGEQVVTKKHAHPYLVRIADPSEATRVLFVGDSHTHAHEVSSGQAYYDFFDAASNGRFSVFAAGVGGFGNLQEYMLLERVWDEVQPEIVIWQLDPNDVNNNVYELDSGSFFNNQRPRPYLDLQSDHVEIRDPGFFLFDVSQLFRFVFHRLLALDWKHDLGLLAAADTLIAPRPEDVPRLTEQGLEVLRTVLSRAVSDHPDTRFFGFSAAEDHDLEFQRVFTEEGAGYFADFALTIASSPGVTDCLPLDAHWNHRGNEVAGRLLVDLLDQALLDEPPAGDAHPVQPAAGAEARVRTPARPDETDAARNATESRSAVRPS